MCVDERALRVVQLWRDKKPDENDARAYSLLQSMIIGALREQDRMTRETCALAVARTESVNSDIRLIKKTLAYSAALEATAV